MTLREHSKSPCLWAQIGVAWPAASGRDKVRGAVIPCVAVGKGSSSSLDNAQSRIAEL